MSLLYCSAFEMGADIAAGKLSSMQTLEFFLRRIEQFNLELNVVVALDVQRARSRAAEADAASARGECWGPLHGVPMTIKDAFSTEGLVTVGGIPECRDHIPNANALAVQRYIDAGAIVFGKTNVPFMSADLQSYNAVYGTSNNPWNHERTPGGSSGGAAAAVAAGLTPLELGSDIGGSIRTPCHFNGVFGHKASHGIVPQRGHLPPGEHTLSESDLSVVGPIGTCIDDLEKALDIIAGPLPEDASAWQLELAAPSFAEVSELRVAVWADDDFCRVEADISRCINEAGDTLERLGAFVDRSARPSLDPEKNHHNYIKLLMSAMGAGMPEAVYSTACEVVAGADGSDSEVTDYLLASRGVALSHRRWLKENERRLRARSAWATFFTDFDVLLCPCTHVVAFPHDHEHDMYARVLEVNGEPRPYVDLLRWAGLTLNSLLPATVVPVGQSGEGLPIGVQIVAPFLGDRTSLAVGRILEAQHRAFTGPAKYQES